MNTPFDFDEIVNRRGTGSVKWDRCDDASMLPMWVADMDFKTAPAIIEAVKRRAAEGVYGYVHVPDSYYEAVINWFEKRHGWSIASPEDITYIPGIVPALGILVNALTNPGDGVIFQTPAYNCFFSMVENNGRKMALNPLLRRETETGYYFEIDFDGLERLAAKPENRVLLLCNPHNPTGRVWTREELQRVSEISKRHGVIVVSDEIHCEIVHPGFSYTPFATVDADCVTCCSPTKGFNIAGLLVSNIITHRADLRSKIQQRIQTMEANLMNPFGIVALQAVYNEGGEWLDALNEYLYNNYLTLRRELGTRLPQLNLSNSQSTYLAWADISSLDLTADEVEQRCKERGHVWINSGRMYGDPSFIRINYACPLSLLLDGLSRIFCSLS